MFTVTKYISRFIAISYKSISLSCVKPVAYWYIRFLEGLLSMYLVSITADIILRYLVQWKLVSSKSFERTILSWHKAYTVHSFYTRR